MAKVTKKKAPKKAATKKVVAKKTPAPVKKVKKARRTGGSVIDRVGWMDSPQDDTVKINLYGPSGSGKTTLWSTFPAPILAMLCSGGMKPGELKSINTPENRKRIKRVTLETPHEVAELAIHAAETGKYKTIVLDHASGLQDYVLKEVLDLKEIPAQLSWGLATQQQYGQVAMQMKEYLRTLLNLDINVVIVAQQRAFNAEGDGSELLEPTVGSALFPSVTGWLNPACDYVCQTLIRRKMREETVEIGDVSETVLVPVEPKEVEYCLRTAPDPIYTTKFRVPMRVNKRMPDVIIDPTYQKIMKLIAGG